MDSDQAPPPQRQKQKPQKATEPMPQLGLHRVEPRPVATHPPSPPRRPILWRDNPALPQKPPKKQKKANQAQQEDGEDKPPKKNNKQAQLDVAAISAKEIASTGAKINPKELAHLLQFLLCQFIKTIYNYM